MNTYVIVHLSDLSINAYYPSDTPDYSIFGGQNGDPFQSIHLLVPDELTWDTVMAIKDDQNNITLVEDPVKIQIKLQGKIDANKAFRDICLQKTDFTRLDDVGLTNVDEWKEFRATLRSLDMTPPVSWPTEPSSPWGSFLPTPPQQ